MTEIITYIRETPRFEHDPNVARRYGKWPRRFLQSFLFCPEGVVGQTIQAEIEEGRLPNVYHNLTSFANDMGSVFSFVHDDKTGKEETYEWVLNHTDEITKQTGMDPDRIRHVADALKRKLIKSTEAIKAQKSRGRVQSYY